MSDFARWLNGSLTRFCGHEMHAHCHGIIHTLGIESSCLCDCHQRAAAPQPLDVDALLAAMTLDIAPSRFWIMGRESMGMTDQRDARALAVDLAAAYLARLGSQEGNK